MPDQIDMIESVKESGVIDEFGKVVREVHFANPPRSIEKFFFKFLQSATPKTVAPFILEHYIKVYGGDRIEIWCSNGVAMIIVGGLIKVFLPQEVVTGKLIKSGLNRRVKASIPAKETDFYQWALGKDGKVEDRQMSFSELRNKARRG